MSMQRPVPRPDISLERKSEVLGILQEKSVLLAECDLCGADADGEVLELFEVVEGGEEINLKLGSRPVGHIGISSGRQRLEVAHLTCRHCGHMSRFLLKDLDEEANREYDRRNG